jgi:DUF4097 and DUF4098 domain-containing protein YvlB
MKTLFPSLLFSAVAASVAPAASAKIERTVEKSFTVQPGGTLHVGTSSGEIVVEVASGNTVQVTAREHIRAASEDEATEELKKLSLTLEQQGADVTAKAEYERNSMGFHFGSPPVTVDFVVKVPAKYSAQLKTSGGEITVGDLGGSLEAVSSGGGLRLGQIAGNVDARTSGGAVRLAGSGSDVELSSSGGSITLGRVAGSARLRTSGGHIQAEGVGGNLQAHTSGGDVSATFTGPLSGENSLSTSGGRVRVSVPSGANFELDASTSGGRVRADGLTLTIAGGGANRSSLRGKVGTGGATLRLHSSGGDVIIESGKVAAN